MPLWPGAQWDELEAWDVWEWSGKLDILIRLMLSRNPGVMEWLDKVMPDGLRQG